MKYFFLISLLLYFNCDVWSSQMIQEFNINFQIDNKIDTSCVPKMHCGDIRGRCNIDSLKKYGYNEQTVFKSDTINDKEFEKLVNRLFNQTKDFKQLSSTDEYCLIQIMNTLVTMPDDYVYKGYRNTTHLSDTNDYFNKRRDFLDKIITNEFKKLFYIYEKHLICKYDGKYFGKSGVYFPTLNVIFGNQSEYCSYYYIKFS